jgi:hypothetical protein
MSDQIPAERPTRRVRGRWVLAVLAALVLAGGGIALAVTLGTDDMSTGAAPRSAPASTTSTTATPAAMEQLAPATTADVVDSCKQSVAGSIRAQGLGTVEWGTADARPTEFANSYTVSGNAARDAYGSKTPFTFTCTVNAVARPVTVDFHITPAP